MAWKINKGRKSERVMLNSRRRLRQPESNSAILLRMKATGKSSQVKEKKKVL